jgi:hypothetical protein
VPAGLPPLNTEHVHQGRHHSVTRAPTTATIALSTGDGGRGREREVRREQERYREKPQPSTSDLGHGQHRAAG